MNRWLAKYGKIFDLIITLLSLLLFVLYIITKGFHYWSIIFLFNFLLSISKSFQNSESNAFLFKEENYLYTKCDPYPLFNETEEQKSYFLGKRYKQNLLIKHCIALRNMGEFEKALEQLETINIDKYIMTTRRKKVMYYIYLADLCLCLNQLEKAEIWINKSVQIFNDLKAKNHQIIVSQAIRYINAEIAYYKKEYDKSIGILNYINEINMIDSIHKSLLFAKIYIDQNKLDDAKIELDFVLSNGNRLVDVIIAKDLYEKVKVSCLTEQYTNLL